MHVTPLFINLHWLPIAARIKFKALMFACKTTTGSTPLYLNSLLQTYVLSRSLHSANERRFIVPSQRGTKSLSQTFKLNVPSWWNDLPNSIQAAESLPIFKNRLKTRLPSLFDPLTLSLSFLILFFKKIKTNTSFSNLFLFYLFVFFLFIMQLTKAKKASNTSLLYSFSIKKPCYMYCIKLIESCYSTCISLLFY